MVERNIDGLVREILDDDRKMAFLSGPRQVGKTSLAKALLAGRQGAYFNWDLASDQKRLLRDPAFFEREDRDPRRPFLVVLDEIHKYARWKNYLKGAYDGYSGDFRFVVAGSGRLDLFRRGGDSLLGRYMKAPLFPLTVGEILGNRIDSRSFLEGLDAFPEPPPEAAGIVDVLSEIGGFPEPYTRGTARFYNRWAGERKTLLVREDVRDATRIREISLVEMLSHMIPERVGSPLSLNSMREDLGVAFETVRSWVLVLEQFYYLFRVTPFGGSLARTLRKEAKAYLYDWPEIQADGPRFENLIALHLLKAVSLWTAAGDGRFALHYLRDREHREVDFVILRDRKPICLVECKAGDEEPAPALAHFQERLAVPHALQVVRRPGVRRLRRRGTGGLWVVSADRLPSVLP